MLSKISILLTNHHLTLKDISQSNSLMEKDLEDALNENPDNWSSAILSALSSSLNMRPGDLLELLDPVYSLKINDTNQMIQGIYIEDPEMYEQIRFVADWINISKECGFELIKEIPNKTGKSRPNSLSISGSYVPKDECIYLFKKI